MHVRWASWGPAHWAWYRRWLLARMGCTQLGIALGTRGLRQRGDEDECVLCNKPRSHGLAHWLTSCSGTLDIRQEAEGLFTHQPEAPQDTAEQLRWYFDARCPVDLLKAKARLVGRALGRVALELGKNPPWRSPEGAMAEGRGETGEENMRQEDGQQGEAEEEELEEQ